MKKIAIVNRTNYLNYGSVLQSYALLKTIENLGYECEIIWEKGSVNENYDFRIHKIIISFIRLLLHPSLIKRNRTIASAIKESPVDSEKKILFSEFLEKEIKRRNFNHFSYNFGLVSKKYDKFVCGSDQVWCSTSLYVDPLMYLRFAQKKKRVAYAPSIGRSYIPQYNSHIMKKYISQIPFVSIREFDAAVLVKNLIKRDIPVVADPSLLIDSKNWLSISNKVDTPKDYLLCYFISTPSEKTQEEIYCFSRNKNKTIVSLNSKLMFIENKINVIYPNCGPKEFIEYIYKSTCVMTDSYHGMLFSLIFNKQFYSIEREYEGYDQSSRQLSLLKYLSLEENYIKKGCVILENNIDYNNVNKLLTDFKEKSLLYLKQALEG